jgi:hypothetical protein
MLAVAQLTPTVQAICWFVAMLLFIIAAFIAWPQPNPGPTWRRVDLVALGLAFGAFVFFWSALARA